MFNKLIFIFIICVLLFLTADEMMSRLKPKTTEPFVSSNCPTTMIKKGGKIMIYDPKMAKIPGVNPIYLNSLKDYEDFLKWQKASGLKCPILHLEKEFNAQGFEKYEVKKSFSGNCENTGTGPMNHQMPVLQKEPSMGLLLDANKNNDIKFNQNLFPAYDPYNQNIGKSTTLDS
uniref:Uncharacterized protein n=1 Tax=Florenciella sp. virus SA2 TaxID=3240092 RepID=A0AB39JBT9_9VIRU